jgi:hypothetical protein
MSHNQAEESWKGKRRREKAMILSKVGPRGVEPHPAAKLGVADVFWAAVHRTPGPFISSTHILNEYPSNNKFNRRQKNAHGILKKLDRAWGLELGKGEYRFSGTPSTSVFSVRRSTRKIRQEISVCCSYDYNICERNGRYQKKVGTRKKKKEYMNEKWDLGESNPVLLLQVLLNKIHRAAVHRTPGPFPSSYSQSQYIPCQMKKKGKKGFATTGSETLGSRTPSCCVILSWQTRIGGNCAPYTRSLSFLQLAAGYELDIFHK